MKVLFLLTGSTFKPSAETSWGFPPPKVIQKEVEAEPLIILSRTFFTRFKIWIVYLLVTIYQKCIVVNISYICPLHTLLPEIKLSSKCPSRNDLIKRCCCTFFLGYRTRFHALKTAIRFEASGLSNPTIPLPVPYHTQ